MTMNRIGDRLRSLSKPEYIWLLIAAIGAVLRLREYAERLSFGNDEAALARNIVERTFSGLTQPLDYHQGAPILFLFIQKSFILVFGNQDFILELFPLISGLFAIYLFDRIARKHFGLGGLFATFAFAISSLMILYSSNPKQYSSDAMIALLLVYLADHCLDQKAQARDFLLLGVAGTIAIWLSHPAALVLSGIILVIVFVNLSRKDHTGLACSFALGAAWAASFGFDFIFSLRHLSADPYLVNYWRTNFVPLPPWSNLHWYSDTYLTLLNISLNNTNPFFAVICFIAIIIGSASLLGRNRTLAFLILLPFVMAFIASLLQKYPLGYRFMLFLVPFVYLLIGEGLAWLYTFIAKRNRYFALISYALIFVILLSPAMLAAKRNFFKPQRLWDMRAAVEFIARNWKEGDTVLVSGGGETFSYYNTSQGLNAKDTLIDNNHRIIRWGTFILDLGKLADRDRVWIVFAHFEKGDTYARYARYIGRKTRVENIFQVGYARVYLYDLNP
jgi:hypothetical protein